MVESNPMLKTYKMIEVPKTVWNCSYNQLQTAYTHTIQDCETLSNFIMEEILSDLKFNMNSTKSKKSREEYGKKIDLCREYILFWRNLVPKAFKEIVDELYTYMRNSSKNKQLFVLDLGGCETRYSIYEFRFLRMMSAVLENFCEEINCEHRVDALCLKFAVVPKLGIELTRVIEEVL